MSRHDTLIIKDTHRGLLYRDGVFRDVLPAGRYQVPRAPSGLARFLGARVPIVEVVVVDVRGRDRTIVVDGLLTADRATISASFVMHFRVIDPLAAVHQVRNFEERLSVEAQTAARRVLRGLSVEEVMASRDEIGEEVLRQVRDSASGYGLDVTGLDFKDLLLPNDLRGLLDRGVVAERLRRAPAAGRRAAEAAGDPAEEDFGPPIVDGRAGTEDDFDLLDAEDDGDGDRRAGPLPPAIAIRLDGERPRGVGFAFDVPDVALHRCRP